MTGSHLFMYLSFPDSPQIIPYDATSTLLKEASGLVPPTSMFRDFWAVQVFVGFSGGFRGRGGSGRLWVGIAFSF